LTFWSSLRPYPGNRCIEAGSPTASACERKKAVRGHGWQLQQWLRSTGQYSRCRCHGRAARSKIVRAHRLSAHISARRGSSPGGIVLTLSAIILPCRTSGAAEGRFSIPLLAGKRRISLRLRGVPGVSRACCALYMYIELGARVSMIPLYESSHGHSEEYGRAGMGKGKYNLL
jgi:hypothetical protein